MYYIYISYKLLILNNITNSRVIVQFYALRLIFTIKSNALSVDKLMNVTVILKQVFVSNTGF